MKYSRKGHTDRKTQYNRTKRSGQAQLVYVKTLFSHSVLPVLSLSYRSFRLYVAMKVSFNPDIIPSG